MPQRRQDASAPAIASVPRRLCRSVVVLGVVCLLQGGIFTYSSGTAGAEEEYSQALLSATQIATQAETEPGELEAYALALVNQARRQAGLAPLAWDPLAARVARTHASWSRAPMPATSTARAAAPCYVTPRPAVLPS